MYQLETITISEERLKEEERSPHSTVTSPELLLQGKSVNLDGALLRLPGIDVQRLQEVGGALDDESIKLRGFGSRRIALTLDGRLLNTPGTAGGYFIDWTAIPLSNIEKIVVTKGYSEPKYGNFLGVINLISKKPKEKAELEVQAMKADFNTEKITFFHAWKPSKLEYSISGNYVKSDGYLRNGHYEVRNLQLYVGHLMPFDGKFKVNFGYSWLKKGFIVNNRISNDYDNPNYDLPLNRRYPASDGEIMYGGMGTYPEDGSWWKRERFNFDIGYEQSLYLGIAEIRFWKNYAEREAYNTRRALNRVFHKKWYDDKSYGGDGSYRFTFNSHQITFGFDYVRFQDDGDKNLSDDFRPPFRNRNYVNSETLGVYFTDDFQLATGLTISPGLRYVSYDGNAGPSGRKEGIKDLHMEGLSPSIRLTYNWNARSLFYLAMTQVLRVPTPPEHYWHYSPDAGVYTGDLPLRKEKGLMVQVGWKGELPTNTCVEVHPYYYRVRNYIYFDLINFVSYNIPKVTLLGCEIEISQKIKERLSVFANYSFQKSNTEDDPFIKRFLSPQDRDFDKIPGLPDHKVNFGVQYRGEKGEKIRLYGRFVSSQHVIYNNNRLFNQNLRIRTQKSYFTTDLEATIPLTKNVHILGYLHNVFDEKYQERFGYPAARRNWGIGIKGNF
ncbi:MAG: TonB-dependent receptor [Deltaproteobacteria bacterium]|nr:TonB-dependent receptor [Deltaproteobacteria bacterium]